MPESLDVGRVYEIKGQNGEEPTYGRIVILGPSDLSTQVEPATQADYEKQQKEQKPSA